jgi:hypothetical protein
MSSPVRTRWPKSLRRSGAQPPGPVRLRRRVGVGECFQGAAVIQRPALVGPGDRQQAAAGQLGDAVAGDVHAEPFGEDFGGADRAEVRDAARLSADLLDPGQRTVGDGG